MPRSKRHPLKAAPKPQIAELYVVLEGTEPAVWRRVRMPYDTPLSELHRILVIAMGWEGYHLHAFKAGDLTYGELDDEWPDDTTSEDGVALRDIAPVVGATFVYEYDFGDDWQHVVTLEQLMPMGRDDLVVGCSGGARACPPEDVGGVSGYQEMLDVLTPRPDPTQGEANADDDNREENTADTYRGWLGYEFDPDEFHLRCINRELMHLIAFDWSRRGL